MDQGYNEGRLAFRRYFAKYGSEREAERSEDAAQPILGIPRVRVAQRVRGLNPRLSELCFANAIGLRWVFDKLLPRFFWYPAMLKIILLSVVIASLGIEPSNAADVQRLRLAVPNGPQSALLVGAQSIRDGVAANLSSFARIDDITVSQDPLSDLNDNKTDIAVVPTSSLSSDGVEKFGILTYRFSFRGKMVSTSAQARSSRCSNYILLT